MLNNHGYKEGEGRANHLGKWNVSVGVFYTIVKLQISACVCTSVYVSICISHSTVVLCI